MNQGDVLFRGIFDLGEALDDFGRFATAIEKRLQLLTKRVSQTQNQKTANRVEELLGINDQLFQQAEKKVVAFRERVRKALEAGLIDPQRAESVLQSVDNRLGSLTTRVDRLNHKIEEGVNFTKGDILALRQINHELNNFDNRLNKAERTLAATNIRIKENAKSFNEFFRAAVIGGFALQQLGGFLIFNVTQPLIRLGKELLNVTTRFDELEQLFKVRGQRTAAEIANSIDLIGRTAKLRKLDLENIVTLYSRLFEATRGAIDDQLFEQFARGLSHVLTTLESGERRSFFGQIQDILGGGDVANLEKTLSLVPLLKSYYDEVKRGAGEAASQQEILIEAFARLAELPEIDDLGTKIKNLGVQFELWGYRISVIYKDNLENLVTFIEDRVFPVIERMVKWLENQNETIQNLIPITIAAVAAIGPLIYVLGTLGVVTGGVAYVIRGVTLGLGALTGSTVAAKLAAADLSVLLANAQKSGGAFAGLLGFLPKVLAFLNPITLAVGALALLLGYVVYRDLGNIQSTLSRLAQGALKDVQGMLNSLIAPIELLLTALAKLIPLIENTDGKATILGLTLSGLVGLTAELISRTLSLTAISIKTITTPIQFLIDLINDGLVIAFYRLRLTIAELEQQIRDTIPFLDKFMEWIESRSSYIPEYALTRRIEELKKKIEELGGETKNTEKVSVESFENINRAGITFQAQQNAIAESVQRVTDALRNQVTELQNANFNYGRFLAQQAAGRTERAFGRSIADIDEFIGDADLTDPTQREQARQRVIEANRQNTMRANARLAAKHRIEIHEEFKKQRDELVKLYQNENETTLKSIYSATAEIYSKYASQPGLIFPTIEQFLADTFAKDTPAQHQRSDAIRTYFKLQKDSITALVKLQNANQEDYEKALEENFDRIKSFNKRVQQSEQLREQTQLRLDTALAIGGALGRIQDIERMRDRFLRQKDELGDLNRVIERLQDDRDEIFNQYEKIRDNEIKQIQESTRSQLEKDEAEIEAWRNYENAVMAASSQTEDLIHNIITEIVTRRQENLKRLRELILSYKDVAKDRLELFNELVIGGAQVSDEQISQAQKQYTDTATQGVELLVFGASDRFIKMLDYLKSFVGQYKGEGDKVIKEFYGLYDSFVDQGQYSSPDELKKFLEKHQLVLRALEEILRVNEFANDVERANFQKFVDEYITFIEGIKRGSDILDTIKDVEIESLRIKETRIQKQLELNDIAQNELRIREAIVQLQKDRGYLVELKGLKDFAGEVLDLISGGSRNLAKIQRQILEREKEANQLEIESALLRLQMEQRILELKILASELSKEEKDRLIEESQKETGRLMENIKRQGELQRELLNEQLNSLKEFGSSIGEIIFSSVASAIGKLFGKKKDIENEDTPSIGEDGALTGLHEELHGSGQELDKFGEKYKKVAGIVGSIGKSIVSMNEISMKSIRNALAETLKAIAAEAAVRALQYAAIALSALVFGDYGRAAKAGIAAAAWTGVALAAKAGSDLLHVADDTSAANSRAGASRGANVTESQQERDILRQKALSVLIQLDIRTDDGIIVKKNIKALNQNTELSNLALNSQEGWAFAPTP